MKFVEDVRADGYQAGLLRKRFRLEPRLDSPCHLALFLVLKLKKQPIVDPSTV